MTSSNRILVTFPGKLGDLIYTLPAVMALARSNNSPITYLTSPYCQAAQNLVESQSYIQDCLIDHEYQLEHVKYGCQPYTMSEPAGFDRIYHLGFRPEVTGNKILRQPLIATFFQILEKIYSLALPAYDGAPYLAVDGAQTENVVLFQGHGHTLMDLMDEDSKNRLLSFWRRLFQKMDYNILAVSGPNEKEFYEPFGLPLHCPQDMLETARMIKKARLFIGVQSAAAALADGLKTPRLVFSWFNNALPTGANGLTFSLDADPAEVAHALTQRYLT
jgi:ADP-heptose:LPS heptosyltransferase